MPYRILPCPWDDRERLDRAVHECSQAYEHILKALSALLNDVHGVSHSARYWRLLIGPWLMHFCHVVYDRQALLNDALSKYPGIATICLSPESFQTPRDTAAFIAGVEGDLYNLQLFTQILTFQDFQFPHRPFVKPARREAVGGARKYVAKKSKDAIRSGYRMLMSRLAGSCRLALCDLYISRRELYQLAVESRFRMVPLYPASPVMESDPVLVDHEKRKLLSCLPAVNAFEKIVIDLLPVNLPELYYEGYSNACNQSANHDLRTPVAIMTANGWFFNEGFKLLAAARMEDGAHLLGVQHGGGYGWARHMPFEEHERAVCDKFYAWGWADGQSDTENLPSPRLSAIGRRPLAARKKTDILLVSTNHPQYLYRFQSFPVGSQFERYLAWQERFIAALPVHLRENLVVRLYAEDFGREMAARLKAKFPYIRFDTNGAISKSLLSAQLVVIDHNMTTMLETLSGDIPTVLFWDPLLWQLREDAVEWFGRLGDARIYHNTPEQAASHIGQQYGRIMEWWGSDEVQSARTQFTTRYAQTDANWPSVWCKKLTSPNPLKKKRTRIMQKAEG